MNNQLTHDCRKELYIEWDQLNKSGWLEFSIDAPTKDEFIANLLSVAVQLGTPVPSRTGGGIYDLLRPTEQENSHPNSLSRKYSSGEFPLHVDTAHWIIPCHYVMLGCLSPGVSNRATFFLDTEGIVLSSSQFQLLHQTPIRIVNGRKSFFGTIFSKERRFVRYDPGCMKPVCNNGQLALDIFSYENCADRIQSVNWIKNKVIIFNNWRMLHGRQESSCINTERALIRISIK